MLWMQITSGMDTNIHIKLFPLQVFDNYAVTVMIGGEPYTLGLFDTAGKTGYYGLNVKLTWIPFLFDLKGKSPI